MSPRRISTPGLLLVLLALTAQLAFGAIVPRPEIARVLQGGTICHAPLPPGAPPAPVDHGPAPDHLLCPLATALAAPGLVLLGNGVTLPLPRLSAFHRPGLPPPATAPPAARIFAAKPRGPPFLA